MRRTLIFAVFGLIWGCGTDEKLDQTHLPTAPIEVRMDTNGVPHIYGATDRDAFYGAGYMMATHRLLQVDMARRRALGRSAEVLPEHLDDDKLARLFKWAELGREASVATQRDNPEEWAIMTAWVAGLNRRIAEVRDGKVPRPYGFGPGELDYLPELWNDEDVLTVAKMIGFGNDESIEFELFVTIAERLFPDKIGKVEMFRPARNVWTVPPEDMPAGANASADFIANPPARIAPPVIDEARVRESLGLLRALHGLHAAGSNNWAVDGRFTENGKPFLAGDPHLGFDFPGVFYTLHINSADHGGSFDVEGFSFPGLPGVSIGHTPTLAWTPTTAFADVMDVWEVPSPDYDSITLAGKNVSLVTREETIHVRDKDDVTIEERDAPGLGVILPANLAPIPVASVGHELLLRWTGFDTNAPSRLLGLNRARSLDEFDAAVDRQNNLNFNMLAVDATGLTYRVGLDVPDRDPKKGAPWKVMDGSDPATRWSGAMLPANHLPRGRAKVRGFIDTANNDPFGFSANGRVDDDAWYYGAFFDPGWRAARATDEITRLTKAGKIGLPEMEALQTDVHANMADDLIPMLDAAWKNAPSSDPDLATLMSVLDGWDRRMNRASSGAVVFDAFIHFAASSALEDDLGILYRAVLDLEAVFLLKVAMLTLRGDYPDGASLLQGGRDAVLLDALARTAAFLKERFGSVDPKKYAYSDLHISKWKDALGSGLDFGENPSDGGEDTINVSPQVFLDSDTGKPAQRWTSSYGPILRNIESISESGVPELFYDFPLGNIADPASPHFDDMRSDWLEGKYRRMPFSRAEVEAATESVITLE